MTVKEIIRYDQVDHSNLKPVHGSEMHFEADSVFIKQIVVENAGDVVNQHAHTFDHTSMVPAGSAWRVFVENEHLGDFHGPCGIPVAAGKVHGMMALLPNSHLYCIHNTHGWPRELLEEKLIARRNPVGAEKRG